MLVTRQVAAAPADTLIDANFGVIRATVDRLLDGFLAMLPLLAAAIFVFVLLLFAARGFRHVTEKALKRSSGVAEAIAGAGMDLPFPTQVVLFHDQTEETDGDRTRQRDCWPAGKNPPKPRSLPPPCSGDNEKPSI